MTIYLPNCGWTRANSSTSPAQTTASKWIPLTGNTNAAKGNGYIFSGAQTLALPAASASQHGDYIYAKALDNSWATIGGSFSTPIGDPPVVSYNNQPITSGDELTLIFQTTGFSAGIPMIEQVPRWVAWPGGSAPLNVGSGGIVVSGNGNPASAPSNPSESSSYYDQLNDIQWNWDPSDQSYHTSGGISEDVLLASLPADTWTLVPLGGRVNVIHDFQIFDGLNSITPGRRQTTAGRYEINSLRAYTNLTIKLIGVGVLTP